MRKFKKSMGCCLLLIVLAVFQAGNVFALNDAISGAISGQLTGTTLTVTIQPDISISSGTTLSLFVVATINNAWVYLQPSGQWTQWVGPSLTNSFPAYQTFTTSKTPADPVIIKPIQNLDLSSVTGAIIYVGYGTSFNAMMSNGSCQPVAVVPTATVNSPIAYPASLAPSNWPNHIAMGAAMDTIADIPYNATVEAIYKYATGDGAPGQIVAPTVIQKLIDDAGTLSKLQMSHQNNYYSVRPVLVEYTANGSQSLAILQADFTRDKMAMHFINLMKDCNAIGAKNSTNASIVLNPDLLGEIEQQLFTNAGAANQTNPNFIANVINGANANINATQLLSGCASNCSLPINEALKIAVYFINNYPDSTSQTDFATATANYTDVTQAKVNNNSATVSLPSVTQDFAGYIRSINWIVKNYAPKATFGWHSNIRAAYDVPWNGIYDGLWAHTMPDNTAITAYASVISTFWKNLGVFSGDWKPDFIVFDKYGINGLSSYVSTFSNGYLFNQQDMNSYFAFVKAITSTLWVPAMLWQIPGGHVGADITNTSTMSTEAQYLFGDKNFSTVNIPTDKLSAYYRSYSGNDLDAGKFLTTTCGASPCDWSIPHLATAANANVFAVLWGTGTRSTSIGAYPGGDQLDGGWLMNKVNAYYNVPFFTDGATTPTVLSSLKLSARFIGTMPADLADELDQEFIKASTDSNAPLIISGVDVSTLSEAERSAIKTTFDYDIPITLVRPTCAQREALYSLVELPGTDLTDDIYEFWGLQTSRKFEIWEYAFASPAARQVTVTDIITCQEDGTILITHGPPITDDLKDVHDYQSSRVAGLREWLVLAPDRANSQTAVGTDSSTLAVESAAEDGPKAILERVVLADSVSADFSYLSNQYAVTLDSRSVYQSPFNYFVISARG
ncbi:MAG: hypothetical protein WCK93_13035, partial [Nitrosomonadales bacterium]